jgi:hypothetical protein
VSFAEHLRFSSRVRQIRPPTPISRKPNDAMMNASPTKPTRGRKPRSPRKTAEIARTYVDAVRNGDAHPIAAAAHFHNLKEGIVRNVIFQARQSGLLSQTLKGRPGGELTAEAKRLLAKKSE